MKNDEEILLGQIFIDNSVFYKTKVNEKDFTCMDCRSLFNTMQYLSDKGLDIDEVKVRKENQSINLAWLATLRNRIPSSANYEYYENRIKENSSKQKLINIGNMIINCFNQGESSVQVKEKVETELTDLSTSFQGWEIENISEVLLKTTNVIEERYRLNGKLPGIPTGFENIDDCILGFRPRMLYLFGARPSRGKTALMLNMAVAAAKNHSVGVINTESANEEMGMRILSSFSGMESQKLATGCLTKDFFPRMAVASGELSGRKMFFYDEPNASLSTIIAKSREMVRKDKVECIFIDYIQNIFYDGKNSERENIGYVSSQLKSLSRSLEIPIIAMAQLRRDSEHSYKRPIMSDLLGSGRLEQDADVIGLIWWQLMNEADMKTGKNPDFNEWVLIDKNRDGATASIRVKFNKSTVKFTEIDPDRSEFK